MALFDMTWTVFLGLSLGFSAGAAGAKAIHYWRGGNASAVQRAAVATLAVVWMFLVTGVCAYLAQRFTAAVMSFL